MTRYSKILLENPENVQTYMKQALFLDAVELELEDGSCEMVEVKLQKAKIEDKKPIVIGNAILQYSKLLLLKFAYFLERVLLEGSYKICYCDTDSLALALTRTPHLDGKDLLRSKMEKIFLPLIKPEELDYFKSEWGNFFVLEDTIEQKRKPGLLKGNL